MIQNKLYGVSPVFKISLNDLNIFSSHTQPGIPQLLIPNENYVLNLPRSINHLRSCTIRVPMSLVEITLRISFNIVSTNHDINNYLTKTMPETLSNRLLIGPSGYCGNAICNRSLFKECCLVVLRR